MPASCQSSNQKELSHALNCTSNFLCDVCIVRTSAAKDLNVIIHHFQFYVVYILYIYIYIYIYISVCVCVCMCVCVYVCVCSFLCLFIHYLHTIPFVSHSIVPLFLFLFSIWFWLARA